MIYTPKIKSLDGELGYHNWVDLGFNNHILMTKEIVEMDLFCLEQQYKFYLY